MSTQQPIGVFDSGVGGLSILKGIRAELPHENLLYLGDIENAPYGDKSIEFIERRAVVICEFLISQGAKAIVVACNTATVSVVKHLRNIFSLPIIGVEPAVKTAALSSTTKQIGVWATSRTLQSDNFQALMQRFANDVTFHSIACHGLVEKIEKLELCAPSTQSLLQEFLTPLLAQNIDSLVLGCTHYPFIKPLLEKIMPAQVKIFDTAEPVAKELKRRLTDGHLLNPKQSLGTEQFYSSGCTTNASDVISALWGKRILVQAKIKLITS
ncbi:glutamate racemase [Colwelliaceae bacterium BS250]